MRAGTVRELIVRARTDAARVDDLINELEEHISAADGNEQVDSTIWHRVERAANTLYQLRRDME